MFLEKYLDNFYYNKVIDNYDFDYLSNLDIKNFNEIYDILIKYKFDYIEDIILNYLDLFELKPKYVEDSIRKLINNLGDNYVRIIGKDMRYFTLIIDNEDVND